MKRWQRYTLGVAIGLAAGFGLVWQETGSAFDSGSVTNGIWSTSLNYGIASADPLTRAAVARRGLLALPKTETVYWAASRDSDGKPLDGSCTYQLTGKALDSRWWSVTFYDRDGYLVSNDARIWSFSGASITPEEKAGWKVTISPAKPASGHWLPSAKGQPFELTLRMYNPGPAFVKDPKTAELPVLKKEGCA